MRTAFARALHELMAQDPRIWLLTADLGFSVLEPFAREFSDRFVNVGVAEQNMTGVAAGLAHSGKIVFTYSIANFPSLRCLEQIRNDVVYHELDVKIVSVGGGYAYGAAGYSHHGLEDLAVMRALPGMTVLAPADPHETEALTRALVRRRGPAYLRLGKAGEPCVHERTPDVHIGRAIELRRGSDVTLISTGGMLRRTLDVATRLERDGYSVGVLSMHTVKPLDRAAVELAARETRCIVTVEEHSITGGLGSAVAEVLASMRAPRARLERFGVPDELSSRIGSQEYLLAACGDLAERVRSALAA